MCLSGRLRREPIPVQKPYPDMTDRGAWNKRALWPDRQPEANITYRTQLRELQTYLDKQKLESKKKTHLFRVLGSVVLQDAGLSWEASDLACHVVQL